MDERDEEKTVMAFHGYLRFTIKHQPIVRNIRNRFCYRLSVAFVLLNACSYEIRLCHCCEWLSPSVLHITQIHTRKLIKICLSLCSISLIIRIGTEKKNNEQEKSTTTTTTKKAHIDRNKNIVTQRRQLSANLLTNIFIKKNKTDEGKKCETQMMRTTKLPRI